MSFNTQTAKEAGKRSKRGKDSTVSKIRNLYSDFLNNNGNKIQSLFDEVAQDDPAKALDFILKLSAYIIPKPKDEDEKAENDLSNVPTWLRPGGMDELSEEEFQSKLAHAKR